MFEINKTYNENCYKGLKSAPANFFHTCVTSPPYFRKRDYGIPPVNWPEVTYRPMTGAEPISIPAMICQLGLEDTAEQYVAHMVLIAREIRRVLRDDGTFWLNIGDSYVPAGGEHKPIIGKGHNSKIADNAFQAMPHSGRYDSKKALNDTGLEEKQLIGIPWRVALALQADGWWLRMDNIWHKTSCLPESVEDRPTNDHEYVYLLAKSPKYYYDNEAIKEPAQDWGTRKRKTGKWHGDESKYSLQRHEGLKDCNFSEKGRNKRSVWSVATANYKGAHYAVFPPELIEPCILAGSPVGGIVLDPFMGSGTTAQKALELRRNFVGYEMEASNNVLQDERTNNLQLRIV